MATVPSFRGCPSKELAYYGVRQLVLKPMEVAESLVPLSKSCYLLLADQPLKDYFHIVESNGGDVPKKYCPVVSLLASADSYVCEGYYLVESVDGAHHLLVVNHSDGSLDGDSLHLFSRPTKDCLALLALHYVHRGEHGQEQMAEVLLKKGAYVFISTL